MMDRRRTMDESILDSDHEITRLRSLASGNFEKSDPKPIKSELFSDCEIPLGAEQLICGLYCRFRCP